MIRGCWKLKADNFKQECSGIVSRTNVMALLSAIGYEVNRGGGADFDSYVLFVVSAKGGILHSPQSEQAASRQVR